MPRTGTFVQRWRVPLGFLCGAIFLLAARPTPAMLAVGGALAIIGLLNRAWASGHIRKNDALAVSGPYAYTRNPLYLGSFLLGIGFTVAANNLWLIAVFAALFLGIYLPVMRVEARTLRQLFGTEYEKYSESVPLLLPRLTPYKAKNKSDAKFNLDLYLRYREYRAALGLIAAWSLLFLKAAFF